LEITRGLHEPPRIGDAGEADVSEFAMVALTRELGNHAATPQCLEELQDALVNLDTV
jgi:hypothetical protein